MFYVAKSATHAKHEARPSYTLTRYGCSLVWCRSVETWMPSRVPCLTVERWGTRWSVQASARHWWNYCQTTRSSLSPTTHGKSTRACWGYTNSTISDSQLPETVSGKPGHPNFSESSPVSPPVAEVVPGHRVSFSSYPGMLLSGDDFYQLSSKLVSQQTVLHAYKLQWNP